MSAKDRLLEALEKDREERERRLNEGEMNRSRPFPLMTGQESDGIEDVERPFLPDVTLNRPLTVWRIRQWMTGPQS